MVSHDTDLLQFTNHGKLIKNKNFLRTQLRKIEQSLLYIRHCNTEHVLEELSKRANIDCFSLNGSESLNKQYILAPLQNRPLRTNLIPDLFWRILGRVSEQAVEHDFPALDLQLIF